MFSENLPSPIQPGAPLPSKPPRAYRGRQSYGRIWRFGGLTFTSAPHSRLAEWVAVVWYGSCATIMDRHTATGKACCTLIETDTNLQGGAKCYHVGGWTARNNPGDVAANAALLESSCHETETIGRRTAMDLGDSTTSRCFLGVRRSLPKPSKISMIYEGAAD